MQMAQREIMRSAYADSVSAGLVLTGTALLRGIVELAEVVFRLPVRCGIPAGITGQVDLVSNPMYATGVGLVQYGMKQQAYGRVHKFNDDHLFSRVYHRMRDWFGEFFT